MTTDTVSNGDMYIPHHSAYPSRYPKLGVSAVLRAKSASPSTISLPRNCESPLRLDEPTMVTCRYRPGLRPVRIIDMTQFRLRRKQIPANAPVDDYVPEMRRSSTMLLQQRKQPLKAFQQNTLPSAVSILRDSVFSPGDEMNTSKMDLNLSASSYTSARFHRISTNPKIRRCNSSEMSSVRKCVIEDQSFSELDSGGQTRKRRSMPTRPSKKIKSRDSLDSSDSGLSPIPCVKVESKTLTSSIKVTKSSGMMTRIRSQTQLAYEAVKRVVRMHSKRRSGSYELRREADNS